MRGYLSEGRRWLEAALSTGAEASEAVRAKALAYAGLLSWEQGDYERSVALGEESLSLSRELEDKRSAATALYTLAWAAMFRGDLERASTLSDETLTLQRAMNDRTGVARTLLIQGLAANAAHDYELAMTLHEESLALARETGDSFAIVLSLAVGAYASLGRGDHQRTSVPFEEGLELARRLGMAHLIAAHLHAAACWAGVQGRPVRSARLWGAGETLRQEIGTILSPVERDFYEPYVDAVRTRLGESAFRAAWAEGKAMAQEEAVEYALGTEVPTSHTTSAVQRVPNGSADDQLTRREQEIASLVARGLTTNRQISAELFISERTVETHVRNILGKLGLDSRAQLAAWTAERRSFDDVRS